MIEPRPRPGLTGRPRVLLAITVIAFAVLVLRLWSLQVVHADRYRDLALVNRKRVIILRPARGRLLDRAGRPLADNRARLDACIDKSIAKTEASVSRAVAAIHDVLGMPEEEIRARLSPERVIPHVPVVIARDISFEEYAKLKVLEPLTPGLAPITTFTRRCRHGDLAAQTLGYAGLVPSREALAELRSKWPLTEYDADDVVGLAGLELAFEHDLQGRKGKLVIEVDNLSRRRRVLDNASLPVAGADVCTTLDIELQELAHRLLEGDGRAPDGQEGTTDLRRGAFVAMDPRNGDVLALVSTPSFDPSVFAIPRPAEAVAEIQRLNKDPLRPLWNRAISDQYPLGSAFKVVVALAGLNLPANDERRLTGETLFECPGTFHLGRAEWECYHRRAHGMINLVTAIKKSCNVFFYKAGRQIGPEAIIALADAFGLGKPTGLPLPNEQPGVNPTDKWCRSDDWRARQYRTWVPGYTINLSIGQFPLEVTPIQVAQIYATIAMDGAQFKPRLVTRIVRPDGVEEFAPESRRIELSPESLALVKEGLREVTRKDGTAAGAFMPHLDHLNVAGKTSTAQVGEGENEKNLVWFVAFAPVEAPEIVVVVMVEEGKTGGSTAAPIAAAFLEGYFARADQ
ncbi:MAG: penicillin-binding protein 2 [Verrucomicrobia bacterium]|nr:penicillin-binding protein 2 [Verrucomicrobiota bacterium]